MPDVRRDHKGQALWLTIDREDRCNALDGGVLDSLYTGVISMPVRWLA